MTPVLLADLDDTLFTTMKNYQGVDPATLRQVTTAKNGNHSYLCAHRQAILDWVAAGATLVPVTARSLDAFSRVHLDIFTAGAIVSNGALILDVDGQEDLAWSRHVSGMCLKAQPVLEHAAAAFEKCHADIRIHRHFHNETLLGMTVKSNDESEEGIMMNLGAIELLFGQLHKFTDIQTHRNGNNLAFVPGGVSKRAAVQYLLSTREDLQGRPTIGAGDSRADLPFMELCTMMLIPRNTQNSQKLFS